MQSEYYKKLKQDTKVFYSSIGSILCPALNNEEIFFTKAGFNHLIRKGRIPRSMQDQIRRFYLFYEAMMILKEVDTKVIMYQETTAIFWELSKVQGDRVVKVIIRKLHNTEKHFFSVMDKVIH